METKELNFGELLKGHEGETMWTNSNFNKCPVCGSFDYEIGNFTSGRNCKCRNCSAMWWYNFQKY